MRPLTANHAAVGADPGPRQHKKCWCDRTGHALDSLRALICAYKLARLIRATPLQNRTVTDTSM